jgi:hypothetical protein
MNNLSTELLSMELTHSISNLLEIAYSSNRKKMESNMEVDKIFNLIDTIVIEAQNDAQKYTDSEDIDVENFKKAAQIYIILSKVLSETAARLRDVDMSETLNENATSMESYANTILYRGISALIDHSYLLQKKGDYEKYTEYKTKAKSLEYEIKNGIIKKRLEQEANFFVQDKVLQISRASELEKNKGFLNKLKGFLKTEKEETVKPPSSLGTDTKERNILTEETDTKERNILTEETDTKERNILTVEQIAEQVDIANGCKESGKKDWYDWWVYVVAKDNTIINKIKYVTYTLHETFDKPVRKVDTNKNNFTLRATGWGEFEIKADIHLDITDNISNTITKYHWLKLSNCEKSVLKD